MNTKGFFLRVLSLTLTLFLTFLCSCAQGNNDELLKTAIELGRRDQLVEVYYNGQYFSYNKEKSIEKDGETFYSFDGLKTLYFTPQTELKSLESIFEYAKETYTEKTYMSYYATNTMLCSDNGNLYVNENAGNSVTFQFYPETCRIMDIIDDNTFVACFDAGSIGKINYYIVLVEKENGKWKISDTSLCLFS